MIRLTYRSPIVVSIWHGIHPFCRFGDAQYHLLCRNIDTAEIYGCVSYDINNILSLADTIR